MGESKVRSGIQGDQNADVLNILEALEYGGDICP
jgi:hypothetical protein